jgi:hypothetical protein
VPPSGASFLIHALKSIFTPNQPKCVKKNVIPDSRVFGFQILKPPGVKKNNSSADNPLNSDGRISIAYRDGGYE